MEKNRCIAVHLVGVDLLIDPSPWRPGCLRADVGIRPYEKIGSVAVGAHYICALAWWRFVEALQVSQLPTGGYVIRPYRCGAVPQPRQILIHYYFFPHKKTDLRLQVGFFVLALPIFPCSRPQSIVGEGELNFCVRDGNRWTLTPINTNCVEANSVSFASV